MKEKIFPRWQSALICLFILAESLYLPVTANTFASLLIVSVLLFPIVVFSPFFHNPPRLVKIIFAFLSCMILWQSLSRLYHFRSAFREAPFWFCVFFLLTGVLLAASGEIRLSMWSWSAVWIVLLISLISIAASFPDLQFSALQSLSWRGVLNEIPVLWLRLAPAFVLLILFPNANRSASAKGIATAGLILFFLSLRAAMVLGAFGASHLPYPIYAAAGISSIGDFLQRGESIFSCTQLLCELARVSSCMLIIVNAFKIENNTKN